MVYRQGVRTAIVGRPNVGKSSLLNALLRTDRAIVTPVPGTTRDTLEETLNLQGMPLVLVDTAGIAETADLVERLGVERSRRALEQADLVLVVVDGSVPPCTSEDRDVAELAAGSAPRVRGGQQERPADRVAGYDELLPDGATCARLGADRRRACRRWRRRCWRRCWAAGGMPRRDAAGQQPAPSRRSCGGRRSSATSCSGRWAAACPAICWPST